MRIWDLELLHKVCGGILAVGVGVGHENDGAHASTLHNRRDGVLQSIIFYAMREMRADNNHLLAITDTLKLLNDERTGVAFGVHAARF